jgi:hypothetical protein
LSGKGDAEVPRFYFDVSVGDHLTRDDEGLQLDDLKDARDKAVEAAAEIAREALPKNPDFEVSVQVRDEDGFLLFTAGVTMAVRQTIRALSSKG